jgi:hypothetical protein
MNTPETGFHNAPALPQSRALSPAAICIYMQQDRYVCDPALRDTLSQVEKHVRDRRCLTISAVAIHLHPSCITGSLKVLGRQST